MASNLSGGGDRQSLSYSFKVPSRRTATVQVTLQPNKHPTDVGSNLILPGQPLDAFCDFPVCRANVRSPKDSGYAAMYGWIQMVREAPLNPTSPTKRSDLWELDTIPILADADTPFVWFGPEPQLFDGPYRANRTDIDWTAWSFLTYIQDCVMTKSVCPILAIEWGFKIEHGNVTIKTLKLVDVNEAWELQRKMLEKKFGSWTFEPMEEHVEVKEMSQQGEADKAC